jgi:hypothetical protein
MSAVCRECGAPLEGRVTASGVVSCRFCGCAHDAQELATHARRTLIAAADFSGSKVGGWHVGPQLVGAPTGGSPPAWTITLKNDGLTHPLLWAPGEIVDFDVTLAVRFGACDPSDSIFLRGRSAPRRALAVQLFPEGTVKLSPIEEDQWRAPLATARPVKPVAPGGWRRLRWVAVGERHRVFLDGAVAVSATDRTFLRAGHLDVRLSIHGASTTVEVAELAVFDPG